MRIVEPVPVRRCALTLIPGDDVLAVLEATAQREQWAFAVVTGTGGLESADLAVGGGKPPVHLATADVVALSGEVARRGSRWVATLRASLTSSGELRTGRIAYAVARLLVLVVDVLPVAEDGDEDAETKPAIELPRSGPSQAVVFAPPSPVSVREEAPPPSPPATAPAAPGDAMSWASVAAASAQAAERAAVTEAYEKMGQRPARSAPARSGSHRPALAPRLRPPPQGLAPPPPEMLRAIVPTKTRKGEESLYEDPIPEVGDYIDHPQFGLSRVEGDDDTGGIFVRIASGARKSIKLDALEVKPGVVDLEGRKVFPVEGPRRKR